MNFLEVRIKSLENVKKKKQMQNQTQRVYQKNSQLLHYPSLNHYHVQTQFHTISKLKLGLYLLCRGP
jgi:hypothetical protein